MTKASPIVINSSCSMPAPRPRIGAHMIFSSKIPSNAVITIAKTIPKISGSSQVTLTR